MRDEPVDLTSLDVTSDQLRFERLIRELNQRAAPELARRANHETPNTLAQVWGWHRLLIAASALIAALAGSATLLSPSAASPGGVPEATTEVALVLGVPDELLPFFEESHP